MNKSKQIIYPIFVAIYTESVSIMKFDSIKKLYDHLWNNGCYSTKFIQGLLDDDSEDCSIMDVTGKEINLNELFAYSRVEKLTIIE